MTSLTDNESLYSLLSPTGFFRCNRWEDQKEHESYGDGPPEMPLVANDGADPRAIEISYGTAIHEARFAKKRSSDMARFLHHYTRWTAHAESATLERYMEGTVCKRFAQVVREAIEFNGNEYVFGGKGLSFIHAAFCELLECRSLLQHSYAYSFLRYRSTNSTKYKLIKRRISEKLAFEKCQSELESMTEQISDVVARSHIRATQIQITFLTAAAALKRKEFSNVMIGVLLEEKKDDKRKKKRAEKASKRLLGGGIDSVMRLMEDEARDIAILRTDSEESDGVEDLIRESLALALASSGSSLNFDYMSDGEDEGGWACPACTFNNVGGAQCEICGSRR